MREERAVVGDLQHHPVIVDIAGQRSGGRGAAPQPLNHGERSQNVTRAGLGGIVRRVVDGEDVLPDPFQFFDEPLGGGLAVGGGSGGGAGDEIVELGLDLVSNAGGTESVLGRQELHKGLQVRGGGAAGE